MKFLDTLERKFRPFAVPNLTLILLAAQVIGFVLVQTRPAHVNDMVLIMDRVYAGEIWRLGTFLFIPPDTFPILLIFAFYFFYLTGTVLEANWGHVRFNLFVFIAYLATLAAAALVPDEPASSGYIGLSTYLAFAYLYPNFEVLLFFILPVKIKYMALLAWIGIGYAFVVGDWLTKALAVSSVANFLLFFGNDILFRAHSGKRRMEWQAKHLRQRNKPFHQCTICGATEKTHPKLDFRYCSKCEGSYEYCAEHLPTHEHVKKAPSDASRQDAHSTPRSELPK